MHDFPNSYRLGKDFHSIHYILGNSNLTVVLQYTIELDRLEAMNKAIHKEHDKRKQEQQRDRLIDSASPKPDRGSATVREDKHKIVLEKLRQRRRRLTRDLAVMKEKMEKLKTEIESMSGNEYR